MSITYHEFSKGRDSQVIKGLLLISDEGQANTYYHTYGYNSHEIDTWEVVFVRPVYSINEDNVWRGLGDINHLIWGEEYEVNMAVIHSAIAEGPVFIFHKLPNKALNQGITSKSLIAQLSLVVENIACGYTCIWISLKKVVKDEAWRDAGC